MNIGGEAEAAGWAAAATVGYMVCDLLTRAAVRRLRSPQEEEGQEVGQDQPAGHTSPPAEDRSDHQLTTGGAGGADSTDANVADAPDPPPSEYLPTLATAGVHWPLSCTSGL